MERTRTGSPLAELLITVAVIGVVAAIGVSRLSEGRARARVAQVRSTMHMVQVTTEHYATLNDGMYPELPTSTAAHGDLQWAELLPGGGPGNPGVLPTNPFTGSATNLDHFNASGAAPTTDAAGGVALNVFRNSVAGPFEAYDVLGEDDEGRLLPVVLTNQ